MKDAAAESPDPDCRASRRPCSLAAAFNPSAACGGRPTAIDWSFPLHFCTLRHRATDVLLAFMEIHLELDASIPMSPRSIRRPRASATTSAPVRECSAARARRSAGLAPTCTSFASPEEGRRGWRGSGAEDGGSREGRGVSRAEELTIHRHGRGAHGTCGLSIRVEEMTLALIRGKGGTGWGRASSAARARLLQPSPWVRDRRQEWRTLERRRRDGRRRGEGGEGGQGGMEQRAGDQRGAEIGRAHV